MNDNLYPPQILQNLQSYYNGLFLKTFFKNNINSKTGIHEERPAYFLKNSEITISGLVQDRFPKSQTCISYDNQFNKFVIIKSLVTFESKKSLRDVDFEIHVDGDQQNLKAKDTNYSFEFKYNLNDHGYDLVDFVKAKDFNLKRYLNSNDLKLALSSNNICLQIDYIDYRTIKFNLLMCDYFIFINESNHEEIALEKYKGQENGKIQNLYQKHLKKLKNKNQIATNYLITPYGVKTNHLDSMGSEFQTLNNCKKYFDHSFLPSMMSFADYLFWNDNDNDYLQDVIEALNKTSFLSKIGISKHARFEMLAVIKKYF